MFGRKGTGRVDDATEASASASTGEFDYARLHDFFDVLTKRKGAGATSLGLTLSIGTLAVLSRELGEQICGILARDADDAQDKATDLVKLLNEKELVDNVEAGRLRKAVLAAVTAQENEGYNPADTATAQEKLSTQTEGDKSDEDYIQEFGACVKQAVQAYKDDKSTLAELKTALQQAWAEFATSVNPATIMLLNPKLHENFDQKIAAIEKLEALANQSRVARLFKSTELTIARNMATGSSLHDFLLRDDHITGISNSAEAVLEAPTSLTARAAAVADTATGELPARSLAAAGGTVAVDSPTAAPTSSPAAAPTARSEGATESGEFIFRIFQVGDKFVIGMNQAVGLKVYEDSLRDLQNSTGKKVNFYILQSGGIDTRSARIYKSVDECLESIAGLASKIAVPENIDIKIQISKPKGIASRFTGSSVVTEIDASAKEKYRDYYVDAKKAVAASPVEPTPVLVTTTAAHAAAPASAPTPAPIPAAAAHVGLEEEDPDWGDLERRFAALSETTPREALTRAGGAPDGAIASGSPSAEADADNESDVDEAGDPDLDGSIGAGQPNPAPQPTRTGWRAAGRQAQAQSAQELRSRLDPIITSLKQQAATATAAPGATDLKHIGKLTPEYKAKTMTRDAHCDLKHGDTVESRITQKPDGSTKQQLAISLSDDAIKAHARVFLMEQLVKFGTADVELKFAYTRDTAVRAQTIKYVNALLSLANDPTVKPDTNRKIILKPDPRLKIGIVHTPPSSSHMTPG